MGGFRLECRWLFLAFQPNRHFPGEFTGGNVHDARTTADGAVLSVGLVLASPEVDVQIFDLPTEGAGDLGASLVLFAQSDRKNAIKSARSSAESNSGLPWAVPPHTPKRSATLLAQPS